MLHCVTQSTYNHNLLYFTLGCASQIAADLSYPEIACLKPPLLRQVTKVYRDHKLPATGTTSSHQPSDSWIIVKRLYHKTATLCYFCTSIYCCFKMYFILLCFTQFHLTCLYSISAPLHQRDFVVCKTVLSAKVILILIKLIAFIPNTVSNITLSKLSSVKAAKIPLL